MDAIDVLGDIGYGYIDATNAASGMYQNIDKSRVSDVGATRAERQLGADDSYDVFNATAAANRSGLDAREAQGDLATAQAQYKAEPLSPEFRQQIGDVANRYGGLDSPEARRELANLYASKGMVSDADPQYATVEKQAKVQQQQAFAGQKVLAMLKASNNPAYADVQSVELGEDGKVYGFVGDPDETGAHEVVELPPAAVREYAALSGHTALLGYDLKIQQAAQINRAAAMGNARNVQQIMKPPAPQKQLSPAAVNQMRNQLMRDATAQGMSYDQALVFTQTHLPEVVAQVNKIGQQYHDGSLQIPVGSISQRQLNPGQLGNFYGRPRVATPSAGAAVPMRAVPMSPTPFSDVDYSAPVDPMGNSMGGG